MSERLTPDDDGVIRNIIAHPFSGPTDGDADEIPIEVVEEPLETEASENPNIARMESINTTFDLLKKYVDKIDSEYKSIGSSWSDFTYSFNMTRRGDALDRLNEHIIRGKKKHHYMEPSYADRKKSIIYFFDSVPEKLGYIIRDHSNNDLELKGLIAEIIRLAESASRIAKDLEINEE